MSTADRMDISNSSANRMDISSRSANRMDISGRSANMRGSTDSNLNLDLVGIDYDDTQHQIVEYFRDRSSANKGLKKKQNDFVLFKRSIDGKEAAKYVETAKDLSARLKLIYHNIISKYYRKIKQDESQYPLEILARMNYQKLLGDSRTFIFNSEYMVIIQQLLNTILSSDLKGETTRAEKITAWINHLSVISSGSFGRTLKAGINSIDDFFAIKYSIRAGEDLFHEYIVGARLNELRKRNLTFGFVYTYGEFSCTKSIVKTRKVGKKNIGEFISWCEDEKDFNTRYLILENISGGMTLSDTIRRNTLTLNEQMSLFYSLFLSLLTANIELKYSHNDLHLGNILISKISKDSWVSIIVAGNSYYVKTFGRNPFIIDHGLASIDIDGIVIGPDPTSYADKLSKFRGISVFFQDIYRMLFSWHGDLVSKTNRSRDENLFIIVLEKILPFFFHNGKETYNNLLNNFNKYINYLAKPKNTLNDFDIKTLENLSDFFFFYAIPKSYMDVNPSDFLRDFHKDIKDAFPNYNVTDIFINSKQRPQGYIEVLSCTDAPCNPRTWIEASLSKTPNNMIELCYSGNKFGQLSGTSQKKIFDQFETDKKAIYTDIKTHLDLVQSSAFIDFGIELIRNTYPELIQKYPLFINDLESYYISLIHIWHGYYDFINMYHNLMCATTENDLKKLKTNMLNLISDFDNIKEEIINPGIRLWNSLHLAYGKIRLFNQRMAESSFFKNNIPVVLFVLEHELVH